MLTIFMCIAIVAVFCLTAAMLADRHRRDCGTLYCPSCRQLRPTRTKTLDSGKIIRTCVDCDEDIEDYGLF